MIRWLRVRPGVVSNVVLISVCVFMCGVQTHYGIQFMRQTRIFFERWSGRNIWAFIVCAPPPRVYTHSPEVGSAYTNVYDVRVSVCT